ncbi:MAG TPA: A24 family peptidase [Paenibacillus sp.]|nr:A24 family peptidase [Paenibacillus sp.]
MAEASFAVALALLGAGVGMLAEAWATYALRGKAVAAGRSSSRLLSAGIASGLCAWAGFRFEAADSEWVAFVGLVFVLLTVSITDLRAMLIPNAVVFPSVAAAILIRLFANPLPFWHYAAGALIGFVLLYALSAASRGGVGGGDVKLYLFVGLLCGLQATLLSLFVASLAATAFGLGARLVGRRRRTIPFGPFIALGAIAAVLYGERWIEAYSVYFGIA